MSRTVLVCNIAEACCLRERKRRRGGTLVCVMCVSPLCVRGGPHLCGDYGLFYVTFLDKFRMNSASLYGGFDDCSYHLLLD